MSEALEIQSEIYEEDGFNAKNELENKNSLLSLQFSQTTSNEEPPTIDEDGDLLVKRKKYNFIEVECCPSTPLKLVGLQLWRGAFLLADYIVSNSSIFSGKVVLELGTGIGFTSIVAGMYAKEVISTDLDTGGILDIIKRNVARNLRLVKADFSVLPLDFYNETLPTELLVKLDTVDIILAADVIYDNDLTDAFIKTLIMVLNSPGKKKFYLALEKRYVFTIADLDIVAPCYEHFLTVFRKQCRRSPMAAWNVREFPLDFPQRFKYERSKHLVMWEIST